MLRRCRVFAKSGGAMAKILIVEDEVDITILIRKRLQDEGFEVVAAVDAYEGTRAAHREKPDLVILDLMLPVGGGLAVLKNIRASAEIREIPVVVLTGIKDEQYKKQVLGEGVEAYLEKPYEPQQLIDTIRKLIVN
jgi:DNA-binding response OmpR family regulator